MKNLVLGADIGGSHITCRLFDHVTLEAVLPEVRISVDADAPKKDILKKWTKAVVKATGEYGITSIRGIGFAMPGPFDYLNGIALFKGVHKFDTLYGVNVKAEMKSALGLPDDFPIRFHNDAACFAIGETSKGKASEFDNVIALTLGTGFGSTFVKNKLPVVNGNGIPENGFLYNIPYKNSIADDYFSTRWFVGEYKKRTGVSIRGVKELAERASSDSNAKEIFLTFGRNLGGFLASRVKDFRAECIVLGGNISKSFHLFKSGMTARLAEEAATTMVIVSSLDEDAALTGSAKLCDDEFYFKLNPVN